VRNPGPLDIVACPECGLPAIVLERMALESTDGPVEHVRLRCITGSPFLTPTSSLEAR
jgi:hypothetical protein